MNAEYLNLIRSAVVSGPFSKVSKVIFQRFFLVLLKVYMIQRFFNIICDIVLNINKCVFHVKIDVISTSGRSLG